MACTHKIALLINVNHIYEIFTLAFSYPMNASPKGNAVSQSHVQYLPEALWRVSNNVPSDLDKDK